jgi:hypothetical protein
MSAIAEKAMLVAVHISIWTARKHDRAVSKEVAVTHNSEEKLGRFNKRLLAEGTKLEAIQTLAGKIRNYFYQKHPALVRRGSADSAGRPLLRSHFQDARFRAGIPFRRG